MTSEDSTRQLRISRQIQKDLSEIFQNQGMAMYKGALISVTHVRISPDLAVAKVWISIFPSKDAESVLELVRAQARSLRGLLGHRVAKQLRIVPDLTFFLDDSLDYVDHIDQLLKV